MNNNWNEMHVRSFDEYISEGEGAYIYNNFGLKVAKNNYEAENFNDSVDREAISEGYNDLAHKIRTEESIEIKIKYLDAGIERLKKEIAKPSNIVADVIEFKSINIDFDAKIEEISNRFKSDLRDAQEVTAYNLWKADDERKERLKNERQAILTAIKSGNNITNVINKILLTNGVLVTIEEVNGLLATYGYVPSFVRAHERKLRNGYTTSVVEHYRTIKRNLKQ